MNPARTHLPTQTDADARRAAREVFDAIVSRIWLALARHDIPHHDRHDLAQDILLAAIESASRFDPALGEPWAWLYGILHNHLLRYRERRARERHRFVPAYEDEGAEPDAMADPAWDALELLMFDEKRRLAHQLYREIPFELLTVLIAHDLDELTLREIAEQQGVSISTVHDRYNAAHRKLQAAFKRWQAKHRNRGVLVLPLGVAALLDADRTVPDVPDGVREHLWQRFSRAAVPAQGGESARLRGDDRRPSPISSAAGGLERAGAAMDPAEQNGKRAPSFKLASSLPVLGALAVGLVGGAGIHAALTRAPASAAHDEAPVPAGSTAFAAVEQAAAPSISAKTAASAARSSTAPPSAGRAGPVAVDSEMLLREEAAFDTARAAFVQGNMAAAIGALALHARDFPRGQHAPERDKMWIDALIGLGRKDEACTRAESFRRAYPRSGYLPAIEASCPARR